LPHIQPSLKIHRWNVTSCLIVTGAMGVDYSFFAWQVWYCLRCLWGISFLILRLERTNFHGFSFLYFYCFSFSLYPICNRNLKDNPRHALPCQFSPPLCPKLSKSMYACFIQNIQDFWKSKQKEQDAYLYPIFQTGNLWKVIYLTSWQFECNF
jgi:hypothetical protein